MAYYAFVNSENIVVEVIPGRDETETVDGISDWEAYYTTKREGLMAVRTSYNTHAGKHREGGTPFRYNYAGIGFTFDPDKGTDGAFIPPKPFESWVLDEDSCLWEAPVERPTEGDWTWDEDAGEWIEVTNV